MNKLSKGALCMQILENGVRVMLEPDQPRYFLTPPDFVGGAATFPLFKMLTAFNMPSESSTPLKKYVK